MLLMIDNYDSFTYNLVQYFSELGQEVIVRRNDQLSIEDDITIRISALKYETGIDATNSSFKDSNIQAKAVYTYQSNW